MPETHALVAVTLPVAGWSRVAPLAVAGDAASVVFDAGETIAVVGRSTVVVLAPREGLAGRVRVLRGLLARRLSGASGVTRTPGARIVALPATLAGARDTIARLRAAEPPAPRRDRILGWTSPPPDRAEPGPTGPCPRVGVRQPVPDDESGLTTSPCPVRVRPPAPSRIVSPPVDERTGLPVVAMVGGGQLARMTHRRRWPSGSRCGCSRRAPTSPRRW